MKADGLYIVFEENDSLEKSDIYIYGNKFSESEGGYEEVPELVPGNYYIRNESSLLAFFVVAWRDSKYVILANSSDSLSHVFSVKQGDKFRIFLRPKFTNKNNILEKIMIAREKDLNIPYEPYTGGKPSPSPEYPQEVTIAGENETIDLEITGENVELQSLTLSTPNGLPGLKVDKDGNYTDSTGQQWICDEIDLARGKYIQRIGKYIFIGSEPVSEQPNRDGYIIPIAKLDDNILENKSCLSNRFIFSKKAWVNDGEFGLQAGVMFITDKNFAHFNSPDGLKTFLKDNETYIIYPLIRPIETDLPQETITVFKTLHTNYPTTVISNDENAGMEAAYVADTKHYIDKKFEELNQAIVNTQIALL